MAKQFETISPQLRAFALRQHVFFVATATADSRVNLSPKGLDCLRIVDEKTVIYRDLTGSGSETAAHLKADGRLTLMFCAFQGPPMILRFYGRGRSIFRGEPDYAALLAAHYDNIEPRGTRQIVRLDVELVQTSCGFAVPFMSFEADRPVLTNVWEAKSDEEIVAYRDQKNSHSMDGLPTGLGTTATLR